MSTPTERPVQNNADSVRRTLATVRALINCNVTVPQNCRWLTFTYAENMTDEKRLSADWKKFWQKFKRWCVRNYVDEPEFIGVVETARPRRMAYARFLHLVAHCPLS